MTMTDPIADMLTRLRNANQAYHDSVAMPYSKLKQGVAEILKQEGYITSFEVSDHEGVVGKTLEIQLKYGRNRERSIAGVRRISKPGLRVYAKATALPKVRGTLVVVAIHPTPREIDLQRVFWRELRILGARVYEREDFEGAVQLLRDSVIPAEQLISRVVPLDGIGPAVDDLENGRALKVLVRVGATQ